MTVTRRSGSSFADRAYTGGINIDHYSVKPPTIAVVGDLLHAVVRITGNVVGGIPTLPGWTVQTILSVATGSGQQLRVISVRRICQAGDPGTIFDSNILAGSAVADYDGVCNAYVGADTVSPIAFAGGYGSNYIDCPAVPPVRSGSLVLDEVIASTGIGSGSATVPSGDTFVYDEASTRHILALNSAGPTGLPSRAWGIDPGYGPLNLAASTTVVLQPPNNPPSLPGAFTSPSVGQVIDSTATIAWGASTDPDPGDGVVYDVWLTLDNGVSFHKIRDHQPGTSFTYDFSGETASTQAFLHVYAFDALDASAGPTQSATFTVQHNVAPLAPTLVSPANGSSVDLAAGATFDWISQDDGPQAAFALRRKLAGAGSYEWYNAATGLWQSTEVFNPRSVDDFTFPAGKWPTAGTFNWSVATRDTYGLPTSGGLYATDRTVISGQAGVGALTAPAGSITNTNRPTTSWSYTHPTNQPQTKYEVKVFTAAQYGAGDFDPNTSTPAATSGVQAQPTGRNWTPDDPLVNGTTYRSYLRVAISGDLWSGWTYITYTLALTPPEPPAITVTPDPSHGANTVTVTCTEGVFFTRTNTWMTVESSEDAGTTWTPVRGGARLTAPLTGTATVHDYEATPGATTLYRAYAGADL